MKVSDILRVKGNTLYTTTPSEPLAEAVTTMAERDIGSLVVMEHGDLVGMLTFREVIACIVKNGGSVGMLSMMLGRHARYMPVMDVKTLMGVVSFYDVAKAVVDGQDFENRMLKAYIRDWPVEEEDADAPKL